MIKKVYFLILLIILIVNPGCKNTNEEDKNILVNKIDLNINFSEKVFNYYSYDYLFFKYFKSSSEMKEYFKGDIYEDENYINKQIDDLDNEGYFNKYNVIYSIISTDNNITIDLTNIKEEENNLICKFEIIKHVVKSGIIIKELKIYYFFYLIEKEISDKYSYLDYRITRKTIMYL